MLYVLMFAAMGGAVWAHRRARNFGASWGRPVASLCIVVTVLVAVVQMIVALTADARAESNRRETRRVKASFYDEVLMRRLGVYLSEHFAGRRMLVLAGPEQAATAERRRELQEIFERGIAGQLKIAATERPRFTAEFTSAASPDALSQLWDTGAMSAQFDEMMADHERVRLVVSFVGLPTSVLQASFWRQPITDLPTFVVVAPGEQIGALMPAVEAGIIGLLITDRPGFSIREPAAADPFDAFDDRYLMITPQTAGAVRREYQQLVKFTPFGPPK
jgi:hypothetical protein